MKASMEGNAVNAAPEKSSSSMPSDNRWFSWASVASVAAAADEEIAANAFQAADAAPVVAVGGHQKFVLPDVLVLDALKMAYH
jgi:hypothetical protein